MAHTDILGSPVAETNVSGKLVSISHYHSYGEEIEQTTDDVAYTGHKFDADLGLSYMQARYYDPLIGRFYSNDPIGYKDLHTFNRYSYAANNPLKYIDPDGRDYKENYLSLKIPFVGAIDVGIVSFTPNNEGAGNATMGVFVRFGETASKADPEVSKGFIKQKGAIAGLTFGMGSGNATDLTFDDPSATVDVGVGVGTVSIGDFSGNEASAAVEVGPSIGLDATVSKSFTLTGNDIKQTFQEIKAKFTE